MDRKTLEYKDPSTGRRISASEAAKMGLLAIVGAPVLAGMGIAKAIKKVTKTDIETTTTSEKGNHNFLKKILGSTSLLISICCFNQDIHLRCTIQRTCYFCNCKLFSVILLSSL